VLVALSAAVAREPFSGTVPFQEPDALQAVALLVDQFKVEMPPLETVLGVAANVTVGAPVVAVTVTDWTAVPPGPAQVSV
jgi:hypothetical protein